MQDELYAFLNVCKLHPAAELSLARFIYIKKYNKKLVLIQKRNTKGVFYNIYLTNGVLNRPSLVITSKTKINKY